MRNVYMDLEFTGLQQETDLISIGLVSECGRSFYAEASDFDLRKCDDWIQTNVLAHLRFAPPPPDQDEYFVWAKHRPPVLPNRDGYVELRDTTSNIGRYVQDWFSDMFGGPVSWVDYGPGDIHAPDTPAADQIRIVGDCLGYDWVIFNELWGGALNAPGIMHYIPLDLSTAFALNGIDPDVSREEFAELNLVEEEVPVVEGETQPPKQNIQHNALYDARVIKACWEKLHADNECDWC